MCKRLVQIKVHNFSLVGGIWRAFVKGHGYFLEVLPYRLRIEVTDGFRCC